MCFVLLKNCFNREKEEIDLVLIVENWLGKLCYIRLMLQVLEMLIWIIGGNIEDIIMKKLLYIF